MNCTPKVGIFLLAASCSERRRGAACGLCAARARRTSTRRPSKLGDVRPLPKKGLPRQGHGGKNRPSEAKSASGSFGFGSQQGLGKSGDN
ncbi:hypothetical protein OO184_09490 [Photorhabdus sp. APURE]|uniref:hypothetical protein n=1 Tax=Photorhabdus aballayi TaxID=2991723 RepID=UPI00223E639E|nr:hypothetical protein [Photorhabdus aballayi]MCW7548163.1 hypothetical protein [Photorhabdus aballayi]